MPLRETEAIVLRTYRLGEADKIVSLFCRQLGRIRATAAGAQRTKSRYGGTLEPLSYIRLWVFERENRDLLRLNSTELLESFFDMQKQYEVQIAAQYIAEVAERFLPEREVNERAFRLLLAVMRAMKHFREVNRPLLYFDYWILRLAGFLPDLARCASCARELGAEPGYYSRGTDGAVCASCRGSAASRIPAAALKLGTVLRQTPLDKWLEADKSSHEVSELRRFLEEVLESHAERKLVTRTLMAENA